MAGDVRFGIIPAYAGSTGARGTRRYRRSGSSPHTRGVPAQGALDGTAGRDHPRIRGEHHKKKSTGKVDMGIIPAYAGSTPHRSCARRAPRDHPRIRGEHSTDVYHPGEVEGSSPHTRGAPARAGRGTARPSDHPRIRGEHPNGCIRRRRGRGIIPAYAGSTRDMWMWRPQRPGSSPHTRGAPLLSWRCFACS